MSQTPPLIEPVHGVVVGVEGVVPGRDFTYVCHLNLPEGLAQNVGGLTPIAGRPFAPMKYLPHPVGKAVLGARINGVLQMDFREWMHFGPCEPQPGEPPLILDMGGGGNGP